MTPEEIYDFASRYVEMDETIKIPKEGELFALLQRTLPDNKVLKDEEGWKFAGYAQVQSYELDTTAKPLGKWINLHYLSLATFPPQLIELKLQPPHIARGRFQDPSRTLETRILPLHFDVEHDEGPQPKKKGESNILKFPGKDR